MMVIVESGRTLAPRTFKTDPLTYMRRLLNEVGQAERHMGLVAVTNQAAYEHLCCFVEQRSAMIAALMFNAGSLVVDRVPVVWAPECPQDIVAVFQFGYYWGDERAEAVKLVGKITGISSL